MRSHKSFENALKTGLFADVKNFAGLVWSQFLHYRKNILHGSFFGIYKPHFGWGPKFYQIFFRMGQANVYLREIVIILAGIQDNGIGHLFILKYQKKKQC